MTTPTQPPTEQEPPPTAEQLAAAASFYLTVIQPWLTAVNIAVFPPGGIIDPYGVLSGTALWVAAMTRWFGRVVAPQILQPLLRLFGADRGQVIFDQQPFMIEYARQVQNFLVGVPDEVFQKIRAIVTEAADQGTSVPDTADKIRTTLLDADAPFWQNRATVVARTELRSAHEGGLFNAYTQHGAETGLEYIKTWIDADDTRVRPAHVDTDGQRRRIDQPFAVGVDGGPKFPAMYPLDPTLPGNLRIQCRCDMLIEEAGERMTDMSDRGFRR